MFITFTEELPAVAASVSNAQSAAVAYQKNLLKMTEPRQLFSADPFSTPGAR
jgi:hypothetical protein